jgi:hypothetical protein
MSPTTVAEVLTRMQDIASDVPVQACSTTCI